MRELLRKVEPTSFEDLIAILALYRPGPLNSGMLDEYVANKHGRSQIKYPHPSLKHILEETYGIIVYQEQVMRIASELAGFSMGQADELRRAMGKKIPEKMEAMGKLFIENAVKKGIPKEKAKSIFELMAKFAQYGFNKSHSAAYALISFRTAYLKTHYPVEFMASLLTSELNNIDKVAEYVTECKKMGIKVLPPDVNESEADFTVIGDSIRFGLVAVKNVGISAIKEIVKARQIEGRFNSIFDFCSRVNLRVVNRKVLESLIKCGAFDSTGAKRSQLFEVIDKALEVGTSTQKHTQNGQFSLFEGMEKPVLQNNIELPDIDEWHQSKRLSYEKELIGLYITGHPLIPFEFKLRRYADCSISELYKKGQDETVTLGGILTSIRRKRTKNGKIMAYLNLEDLTGSVEIILFPKIFEEYKDKLAPDSLFLIKGRVDTVGEGQPKVNAIELFPLPEDDEEIQRFHISVPFDRIDESLLINLRKILQTSKGKTDVVFHLIKNRENPNQEIVILLPPSLSVEPQESLFKAISSFVGEGSCWLEDLKS
jgi:DNA polymerase-3 subunit alpha